MEPVKTVRERSFKGVTHFIAVATVRNGRYEWSKGVANCLHIHRKEHLDPSAIRAIAEKVRADLHERPRTTQSTWLAFPGKSEKEFLIHFNTQLALLGT